MTETDQLSRMRGVGQGESPGRPPGRPTRQLEFSQAMSDFCYMFPETDEEVIEAVLRANNGMVDATIDQLLTMNIDMTDDDDDLSDRILLSLERDVQQQQHLHHQTSVLSHSASAGLPVHQAASGSSRRSARESKSSSRKMAEGNTSEKSQLSAKDSEDCPPSYTEAVQSHGVTSHHHRSNGSRSNRHRHSPTISRQALGTMQHLLDLGPDTAPGATAGVSTNGSSSTSKSLHHHRDHHTASSSPSSSAVGGSHHHHHHHFPRTSASSRDHRRRWAGIGGGEGSADRDREKSSRPGRNLLASGGHHHHHSVSPHHHDGTDSREREECCGFSRSHHRKGSHDPSFDMVPSALPDNGFGGGSHEKSPHRWRSSHRGEFTNVKRPAYRNWNPPLLGTLPDDFLRITNTPALPSRYNKHGTHLHRTMSAVGPHRPQWYPSSPSSLPSMEAGGATSSKSATVGGHHSKSRTSGSHRPHRSLSFAGNTGQARSPQREFGPDMVQERMKENERRRRMIDLDPQMAMYLEDERLALMMQNSEFLQELRGDQTFMATLEKDQKSSDVERSKADALPVIPLRDDDDRDFIEGYGDDRHNTLEAFPFSQQLPPPVSEDVELRKKLKNMGKASRKQFATLARKFFMKRRKKSAQQILRGTQAPSMVNLLDEDEEDIAEEESHIEGATASHSYNHTSNTQNDTSANNMRRYDQV